MPTAFPEITRQAPNVTAESFGVQHFREAYEQGVNVSQLLERIDPTDERGDDDPDRGLDAFERVLKASGLVITPNRRNGLQASTWGDFSSTSQRRALLVELCARIWREATNRAQMTSAMAGPIGEAVQSMHSRAILLAGDAAVNSLVNPYVDDATIRAKRLAAPVPLAAIVARTTPIDGVDYRSLYITDDLNTDAYRYQRVTEGSEIPATTLVTGEHTLRIHKFGRMLRATYEQLRRQRIDRIAFIIARMALQAEVDKVTDGMNTIINGDGNANTSATVLAQTALHTGSSAGTLTLTAWLTFKLRFGTQYTPDVVLAQEASTLQLLLLPVLSQTNMMPMAMFGGAAFGTVRPINDALANGARYGVTSDAPALKLVTFDSSQALERVTEIGGNVSETERFVTNQTQVLTLTEVEGFGIIDPNASKILNINA